MQQTQLHVEHSPRSEKEHGHDCEGLGSVWQQNIEAGSGLKSRDRGPTIGRSQSAPQAHHFSQESENHNGCFQVVSSKLHPARVVMLIVVGDMVVLCGGSRDGRR